MDRLGVAGALWLVAAAFAIAITIIFRIDPVQWAVTFALGVVAANRPVTRPGDVRRIAAAPTRREHERRSDHPHPCAHVQAPRTVWARAPPPASANDGTVRPGADTPHGRRLVDAELAETMRFGIARRALSSRLLDARTRAAQAACGRMRSQRARIADRQGADQR